MFIRTHYLLYLLLLLPICSWSTVFEHQPVLSIDIVGEDGQAYPVYEVNTRGKSKTHRAWLEALNGQQYALRIQNRSQHRVGLVIAVDGRNIVSGQKSNLAYTERMYVLDAWRTSNRKVNQFFFTEAENSYADAWQDHSAMGVIAVAVFNEKKPVHSSLKKNKLLAKERNMARNDAPAAASADKAEASSLYEERESQAGTGFGEEKYSYAKLVTFKANKHALEKYFYKYEWHETLCRKGVIDCSLPGPNRFWPEHEEYYGYAPYPPG